MFSTQKKIAQQHFDLSLLLWMHFYASLIKRLKHRTMLRYQKKRRLKQGQQHTKLAQQRFFSQKTSASATQTPILSYNKDRSLAWRKP